MRTLATGRVAVVVVAAVALVATALLVRTERAASSIGERTERIAASARGINTATDALLQLDRTNARASAVLAALRPLGGPVQRIDARSAQIAELLQAISATSGTVSASSQSIDTSGATIRDGLAAIADQARPIRDRVGSLDADAARILADLALVSDGLAFVGKDVRSAAALLDAVLADTRDILRTERRTQHLAACIDHGLNGGTPCAKQAR